MAPVSAVVLHKEMVPGGEPIHRCMNSIYSTKNKSKCLESCNPQGRWQVFLNSRTPCQKSFTRQRFTAHCMDLNRRCCLHRKLSHIPPLSVYGMEMNLQSNSRKICWMVESSRESNGPLADGIAGQLDALDSYFSKLQGDASKPPGTPQYDNIIANKVDHQINMSGTNKPDTSKIKSELGSLDNYFDKLDTHDRDSISNSKVDLDKETSFPIKPEFVNKENKDNGQGLIQQLSGVSSRNSVKDDASSLSFEEGGYGGFQIDESSDFYLINLFCAIDIAVFLFEIASPIRDSNFEQLSLPLLYGAKVNKLILDGEWWRLVTPMFLHSGILHVALSCWVLLTFGPQVCRAYGPFTFFLMYMLGGLIANMTSFIHTPELTVSGTGPVFAIIGAWLVYQFQNKDAISKEVSDNLYHKAIIATTLGFFLSDSAQIDQWTHLGAAISGVLYGFFTCPAMEMNDSTPESNQKEGAAIAHRQAGPLKSALTFIIFILVLCPLIYMSALDFDM